MCIRDRPEIDPAAYSDKDLEELNSTLSCLLYTSFIAAEADGLRLEGMSYPINVRAGKGMALTGTANAALGTTLTNVQVAVLDENDQTRCV